MNLEPSSTRYCCILLISLGYVEKCFDGSRSEREQPGPVNCKRRFLSPLFVAAQIAFCADCVHCIERESLYPGAACVYITVLHYVPKRFLYNLCGASRGPGHRTDDTTFKKPNGLSSFVPFQFASTRQSIFLHAIVRSSSLQHRNNDCTFIFCLDATCNR
jgi:hypothetical protein